MSINEVTPLVLAFWGVFAFCEGSVCWCERSNLQRRIYGVGVFVAMITQIFNLFPAVSEASSLQLFCFVGLVLGCLAGARLITVPVNSTSDKTPFKENKTV
jgi:hypothetical protein